MRCSGGALLPSVSEPSPEADEGTDEHARFLLGERQPEHTPIWDWVAADIRASTEAGEVSIECARAVVGWTEDRGLVTIHREFGRLPEHRDYPEFVDETQLKSPKWCLAGTED